jgi:nitrogen fixation protein FixH
MSGRQAFRIKGWHVAAAVGGFFALVVAVDATMIALAYGSFPGQSAANPYEAGLQYNRTLARRSREAALGWQVEAVAGRDSLIVRVHDRSGEPLDHLRTSATLTRPATEVGAERLELRPEGRGVYVASRPVRSGAWDLSVTLRNAAGEEVQAERRLTWR